VLTDLAASGEPIPEPLSERTYSADKHLTERRGRGRNQQDGRRAPTSTSSSAVLAEPDAGVGRKPDRGGSIGGVAS